MAFLALLAGAAAAESEGLPVQPALDSETQQWIEAQKPGLDPSSMSEAQVIADDAREIVNARLADETPSNPAQASKYSTKIFVSRSMPLSDIKLAFDRAATEPDTVVVFRGLLPGTDLMAFRRWLSEIAGPFANLAPPPKIQIDPPAFQSAGVIHVPTVVILGSDRVLAKVSGMVNPDWVRDQVERGKRGTLPQFGPTHEIAEPDLIQVMQQRLARVDWDKWRRSQVDGLRRAVAKPSLPDAVITRTRWHDPSFEVVEDVVANNHILARKGDLVNPLDRVAFLQEIYVIDATDPRQFAAVKGWISKARTRVTVITTRTGGDDSLAWLAERATELGRPIFVWRPDLAQAFGIQCAPTRVRSEGNRFRLDEFRPADLEVGHVDPEASH
ncbi:TrbC family F-type conjugative pilus assembly protein [Ahniella affigens]|nr:TrbC family F-type conjugative pilus assembly protein [Ahniella affigens]